MPRIAQNAASVELLPNNNRTGFLVHNDSVSELRIKWGPAVAAATMNDYVVAIPGGALYESPFGVNVADGAIYGIWAAAGAGAAQVTEV